MKKAFLFDMDGVLADTETMWDKLGYDDLLIDFFGQELFEKVPVKSGMSFRGILIRLLPQGGRVSISLFTTAISRWVTASTLAFLVPWSR